MKLFAITFTLAVFGSAGVFAREVCKKVPQEMISPEIAEKQPGDCLLSWDCGNANCNNPIPASQFFYNAQTGACENAWYLGCGGNYNFFSSQLECHNFCVVKNGNKSPMVPVDVLAVAPDAQEPIEKNCSLEWNDGYENCAKPKPGDLYYFNSEKNSCEKNYFLGCEGNANFFVSQEECSGICMSI